jgi:hypothetical protein
MVPGADFYTRLPRSAAHESDEMLSAATIALIGAFA